MNLAMGDIVQMHLPSGDCPAMVTRVNQDGTLSLTCFIVGDIVHKDNVRMYEPDPDGEDLDEDKYGFWSTW